jgi:hypothetical protein
MVRTRRPLSVLCIVLIAGACSHSPAPTVEEMEAICAKANDRATRSVETVRECIKVSGESACAADAQTGRDEICDKAWEGLDPSDINPPEAVRKEMEHQSKVLEQCYGDGTQSVEEFDACAAALDD